MKHRVVIIISCLLALNLQLRADNYLLLKNPTYKNYVYSAKEQMFLFGYNVSFPLVKNNLLKMKGYLMGQVENLLLEVLD